MKKQLMILLLLLACSCALLKKRGKTTEESRSSSTRETRDEQTASATQLKSGREVSYQRDSAAEIYTIRLWPKGSVNFSPTGGFSGELDSMVVTGKQNRMSSATRELNHTELEQQKSTTNNRLKEHVNSLQKKVEKVALPDVKLIVILAGMLGLAILFAFRAYFSRKKVGF